MKQNKMFIVIVIIIFSLFFGSVGNTKEKMDRWVLVGTEENGDYYYDINRQINVAQNVIQVWDKLIYSKTGKEQHINKLKKYKNIKVPKIGSCTGFSGPQDGTKQSGAVPPFFQNSLK